MKYFIILLILWPTIVFAVPGAPTNLQRIDTSFPTDGSLSTIIWDNYIEGWKIDAFLGNFATKSQYYDGPRLEIGGIKTGANCSQIGTKYYCSFAHFGSTGKNILEMDASTGSTQILMHWTGKTFGSIGEVMGGSILYNSYNDTYYTAAPNCIRKIVTNQDGTRSVEPWVGQCNVPCTTNCDGTGTNARLRTSQGSVFINGVLYIQETAPYLRKITPDGVVTTITLTFPEKPTAPIWNNPYGGGLSYISSTGKMYLIDHYGHGIISEVDLTTNTLTRVVGVLNDASDIYSRHGIESDGPALTHVGASGGMRGAWNSFYNKMLVHCQDASRFRWYDFTTGEVKTYLLSVRYGIPWVSTPSTASYMGTGQSGEQASLRRKVNSAIPNIAGADSRGGILINYSKDMNMVWRAYNPTLGGAQ